MSSNNGSPLGLRISLAILREHYAVFFVLLLTVFTLFAHFFGVTRQLRLDANSEYSIFAVDDKDSGGNSSARVTRVSGKILLECDLKKTIRYAWPYCEVAIAISEPGKGIDLSVYETISFDMQYVGAKEEQVRVYIRNYHPAYADISDHSTLKVNELIFAPALNTRPLKVSLNKFSIASWWRTNRELPIENVGVEFNNVNIIEIATGGNVSPGIQEIIINSIVLEGKYVSTNHLLMGLIGLWVVLALGILIKEAIKTRKKLTLSYMAKKALEEKNKNLEAEKEELSVLAAHDSLTGLLNRQGLNRSLCSLMSDTSNFVGVIIYFDVDRFKKINDTHGHDVGDEVLVKLAKVVRAHIYGSDILARWGGEEFILVCPETSLSNGMSVAERIRCTVESEDWPANISVTCSFGVADFRNNNLDLSLKNADYALYQAKNTGRNKVVQY